MNPIEIGIDARSLLTNQPRGEGKSLIRLYQEIALLRPEWKMIFYGQHKLNNTAPLSCNGKISLFDVPGFRFNTWENAALPLKAWWDDVDVLHCSSSSAPWRSPVPVVMTVHDVIPLVFNDGWPEQVVARFRKQLINGLHSASKIITVSQNTKNDLIKLFDIKPDRITVIPWGIDINKNTSQEHVTKSLEILGINQPYVMAFGGDARRKNTERIIMAFAHASQKLGDLQLVLIGLGNQKTKKKFKEIVDYHGLTSHVVLLSYVSDQELEAIYTGAECLLYPSLYEGFGLPLLEAMSRGIPVVASNSTSIPEVVGKAAILVDAKNPKAISAALTTLSTNNQLKHELMEKGLTQARKFSWKTTADATIEVLEKVARGS